MDVSILQCFFHGACIDQCSDKVKNITQHCRLGHHASFMHKGWFWHTENILLGSLSFIIDIMDMLLAFNPIIYANAAC